jgi:hypothetical protein
LQKSQDYIAVGYKKVSMANGKPFAIVFGLFWQADTPLSHTTFSSVGYCRAPFFWKNAYFYAHADRIQVVD